MKMQIASYAKHKSGCRADMPGMNTNDNTTEIRNIQCAPPLFGFHQNTASHEMYLTCSNSQISEILIENYLWFIFQFSWPLISLLVTSFPQFLKI